MTGNFAIVPVREFGESKQRLSRVLTSAQRADLTLILLSKVLRELQYSLIDQVILVAADANEARKLVPSYSKLEIIEECIHHGGVNSAMRDGLRRIPQTRKTRVLLLPTDLPLITRSALDRAISLLDDYDVIINPSERKDGTNLLGFRASTPIELYYDNNSVTNHIAQAQKLNLRYLSIDWNEFATDFDDEEDLNTLMKIFEASNFQNLIQRLRTVGN
ncbi:MAG: 2-phospho-L-lactate guanylyltransferase [Nitrososphaerales archaeon]